MNPQALVSSAPCCICSGFLLLVGITSSSFALKQYQLNQKIANTPTSKVRSAAAGLVELFGKAKCKDEMFSPVSMAKCVYWQIDCQYYHHQKDEGEWRTFYFQRSDAQMYLEDDTGKMLIDPKGAQFNLPSDFSSTGHLSDKGFLGIPQPLLDPKALQWLERDSKAKTAFSSMGGHSLRVIETFIAEGDPLYVLGSAEPIPGAMSDIKSENLIVKRNEQDKMLFIADSEEKKFKGGLSFWTYIYMAIGFGFLFTAVVGILFTVGSAMMSFGA